MAKQNAEQTSEMARLTAKIDDQTAEMAKQNAEQTAEMAKQTAKIDEQTAKMDEIREMLNRLMCSEPDPADDF